MPREKEYESVAHCPFQRGALVPAAASTDGGSSWTIVTTATATNDNEFSGESSSIACVVSPPDTSIRLSPMFRKTPRTSPRWKPSVHFHEDFKVTSRQPAAPAAKAAVEGEDDTEKKEVKKNDSQETKNDGIFLTFEAIAREGIAVALSPQPKYTGGTTYEIFYGDRGNTQSLVERRARIGGEKTHVSIPGRHCTEKQWTDYWIALYHGKVYAGIGGEPPKRCLGVLDDIATQDQSTEAETNIWYVGMGNSSMSRQGERPFINQYRNIRLSTIPPSLQQSLKEIDSANLPIVNVHEDEMDKETKELLKEYEQECQKAKARAEKFGLPYKEPPSFLPWSKVRRLQANPSDGFATGLDLQDPAEKAKQEARRKRFGVSDMETSVVAGESVSVVVPVAQAWDNEKLVSSQRVDPPRNLWKVVPTADNETSESDTFSTQPTESTLVPEKIHLFAIDWAAFKQIRTNDLSAHFSMYSPTYVEWLGDLSCNIHFQDMYSASRALEYLSQEIPTPPPPEIERTDEDDAPPDLGAMGWRFGNTMLRKISDDRYGRRGTTSRILLRVATSQDVLRDKPSAKPKPPPGFSRHRVLGPGSDFSRENKTKRNRADQEQQEGSIPVDGEPSLLRGSLKASRSGFTVEEMEAERARKRVKTSQDKAESQVEGTNEEKE